MSSEGRSAQEPSDPPDYLAPTDPRHGPGVVAYADLRDADTPWGEEARAMEKSLLAKTAVMHPDRTAVGIPFHALLNEVFGENWTQNGPNYALAYRFLQRYPDYFETAAPSGDLLWVKPTDRATSLIRSIHNLGTPDGDGVPEPGDARPSLDPDALPRERAASVLRSTRSLRTDRQRALCLGLLAEHAETMVGEDGSAKTLHLEGRGETVAGCRFTDPERAAQTRARFEGAADALTSRYDVASWVTFTLPRECVPSVYGSVEVVREALTRLHRDRFGYSPVGRPRPDGVPDYVAVLEPQRDMVAHLHVVYGGEERVMARSDLRADWADLVDAPASKPPQVDVRTLSLDSSGWSVTAVDGEEVDRYEGVREYHREGVRDLAALASMTPDDLHGLAADLANGFRQEEGRRLAGLALPFATDARLTTTSRGLTAP